MATRLWKASILSVVTFPQLLFCFSSQELIGEVNSQNAPAKTVTKVERDSRFQLGGNYTYVTLQPHHHRTFHGSLGGMQALYEYRPMNFFYGAGKFTWRQGNTHGAVGKRSLVYIDGQERLGYTYAPQKKDWFLTLFSGLGFRYLGQKLTPNVGNPIRFRYNEFYVPLGILTNYDINCWMSIGMNYTWMPQIFPTVTIFPLKGARWILKKTLSNFYAELPVTFKFLNNRYQLIINPFYEHWQDGRSTAKLSNGTPLGIPGNTYNFYGVELNFAFCF